MKKGERSVYEHLRRMILFTMLGCMMFLSDLLMEALPNIHMVGVLIIVYTVVYRAWALIPLYIYVCLNGIYAVMNGTVLWWVPYLYVWTVLWGVAMLLPRKMPTKVAVPVYMAVCALHGLAFGTLYAPVQAILFGLSPEKIPLWIAAGFPFDLIHAGGNLVMGVLISPLIAVLKKLEKKTGTAWGNR
jgi:energy-coupling factor transport system substrate-specific component